MRRIIITLFVLMYGSTLKAQTPSLLLLDMDDRAQTSHAMLLTEAKASFNSNIFDLGFLRKFYVGGNISDQQIDKMSSKLRDMNHSGFYARAGIQAFSFSDSVFGIANLGLMARFSTEYDGQLSFSRDLFDVVFKGNANFLNRDAALGPMFMQFLTFQKIGLGVFDKRNYSGVSLSLVNGEKYGKLQIDESTLYTSALGDSLHLTYLGELWRSDTSRSGFGVLSGAGLSIDANINLPMANNKGFISLAISNIGFISWTDGFERMEFDSSVAWTGFEIADVFDLSTDTIGFDQIEDTIEYEVTKAARTTGLPSRVDLRILRRIGERDFYEAGLMLQPNRSSLPLVHLSYTAALCEHHFLTLRAMYGGYGPFRLGWEYQAMIRSMWYLRAGTDDFPGIFSSHSKGASAYIGVAKYFGKNKNQE